MSIAGGMKALNRSTAQFRDFDRESLAKIAGHPIRSYREMVELRKCVILLFSMNCVDLDTFEATTYGNMIWATQFRLGWVIFKGTEKSLAGELGYIVHPGIPYTLDIHEAALKKDLNEEVRELVKSEDGKKIVSGLGLPEHILPMHCAGLSEIAQTKFLQGFDTEGGSGMIFIAGFAVGGLVFSFLTFTILMIFMTTAAKLASGK